MKQGKTRTERLEIAEKLYETTHARQGRSGSLGLGTVSKETLQKQQNQDFSQNATSAIAQSRQAGR